MKHFVSICTCKQTPRFINVDLVCKFEAQLFLSVADNRLNITGHGHRVTASSNVVYLTDASGLKLTL